jgi:hypothetical protein
MSDTRKTPEAQSSHVDSAAGDAVDASRASERTLSTMPDAAPMGLETWDHKDEWRKSGKGFMVVVSRHNGTADVFGDGPHRWNVYAYIYPKHPSFVEFDGPHMWQSAATSLPFHGYPSLLEYPMYEGKVTAVKVGADYHHLHDTHFTHYATPQVAYEVFDDAQALFDCLQLRVTDASLVTDGDARTAKPLASSGRNEEGRTS